MLLDQTSTFEIKKPLLNSVINILISFFLFYFTISKLYAVWGRGLGNLSFWVYLFFFLTVLRGFVQQIKDLVENNPVLSINSEGIYSIIYGRFDKKEILNLKLKVSEDRRVKLMVFLNNPENYLSRNSGLKKMLHEKIYKETGTPIVINVKGKYDLFDLETAVEKFNE